MALLRQCLFELRAAIEARTASSNNQEISSVLPPCLTETAAVNASILAKSNELCSSSSVANKASLVQ